MTTLFDKLRAPFRPDQIHWRVGATSGDKAKGMALAYIDARDVQDRLDEVCGPENWQCRYPHANGKTVCEIGIRCCENNELPPVMRIDGEWIWKADGAGDSDIEAEKGALSDAFKRAAVRWGIGRYLYDLESPWVEIEQRGKSYVIKQAEYRRLAQVAGKVVGTISPAPAPPNAGERHAPENTAAAIFVQEAIALFKEQTDLEKHRNWFRDHKAILDDFDLTPGTLRYQLLRSAWEETGKQLASKKVIAA